jgi:signal transduction histidine kinase
MRRQLAAWSRGNIGFALVALAIACFILMSERAYLNAANTLSDLNSMGQANVAFQRTTTELLAAEQQMNRYLQTADASHKNDFELTSQRIQTNLDLFAKYDNASPQSTVLLAKLKRLAQDQMTQMSKTVSLPLIINMDELRQLRTEWVTSEANYIAQERAAMVASLNTIRLGVLALSVISILALFYYIRQSKEFEKQQREKKEIIRLDRDRLTVEVANRTAQLTELTRHLQSAIEAERSRLSRNLHDDLGALLTSAKLDAARIKARLQGAAPEATELLAHLVETLNNSIALGRQIIEDLRPSTLINLGLAATLDILIRECSQTSGVHVHRDLSSVSLHPDTELTVYRIVQEALTNAVRYAKAKEIWVTLAIKSNNVEISIRDDGIGFDTATIRKSAYGLLGMRFRVEAQGGRLAVISRPGQGATIKVVMPMQSMLEKAGSV